VLTAITARDVPAPAFRSSLQPLIRSVKADAPMAEVLRAVIDESNAVVGVVSTHGRLVGTISERDILRCLPPSGTPGASAQAYARFLQLRALDVMADVGRDGDDEDAV
jgi:predicted transcriptional regulator